MTRWIVVVLKLTIDNFFNITWPKNGTSNVEKTKNIFQPTGSLYRIKIGNFKYRKNRNFFWRHVTRKWYVTRQIWRDWSKGLSTRNILQPTGSPYVNWFKSYNSLCGFVHFRRPWPWPWADFYKISRVPSCTWYSWNVKISERLLQSCGR